MKRELGWFQIGTGLGLFLLCVVALAGCAKVTVQCTPPNAISTGEPPPTGCGKDRHGNCIPIPGVCTC